MLELIAYPGAAAGKLGRRLGALHSFLLNLCISSLFPDLRWPKLLPCAVRSLIRVGAVVPKATVTPEGLDSLEQQPQLKMASIPLEVCCLGEGSNRECK
jgi:hypothetical protein